MTEKYNAQRHKAEQTFGKLAACTVYTFSLESSSNICLAVEAHRFKYSDQDKYLKPDSETVLYKQ